MARYKTSWDLSRNQITDSLEVLMILEALELSYLETDQIECIWHYRNELKKMVEQWKPNMRVGRYFGPYIAIDFVIQIEDPKWEPLREELKQNKYFLKYITLGDRVENTPRVFFKYPECFLQ